MNLKEILTSVLEYLGEEPEDTYIGNQNTEYARLAVFANSSAADIVKVHTWGVLKKQHAINITDGVTLYDLPSDFDRLISNTTYTNNRAVDLPSSDAVIAYNNLYGSSYNYQGRLLGKKVEFINAPVGKLVFDYMSNEPIEHYKSGTAKRFTNDGDKWLLDDELLIRAIKQRYTAQSGENDALAAQDLAARLRQVKIADTGSRSFNINETRNEMHYPYKQK